MAIASAICKHSAHAA